MRSAHAIGAGLSGLSQTILVLAGPARECLDSYAYITGGAMRSSGGSAAASGSSLRLRWLVIVVAVMALLTAGWPLLNLAVSSHRALAAKTTLTIGPSHSDASQVTVGPGWTLLPAQSDPRQEYSISRGRLDMKIAYVSLINRGQTPHLWAGLRNLVQLSNPGVRLSTPTAMTTAQGRRGVTGRLAGSSMFGIATIVADPSKAFAIEMVMLAPYRTRHVNMIAARRIIRSLRLPAVSR